MGTWLRFLAFCDKMKSLKTQKKEGREPPPSYLVSCVLYLYLDSNKKRWNRQDVDMETRAPHKKEVPFLAASWKQLVKNVVKDDNKQDLELVVSWVGVENKPFYAKMRDEAGNVLKDERGNVKRAKEQTGWTATFVEFGTAKVVRVVLPKNYSFEPVMLIKITGRGYDFKRERSFYVDENVDLEVVYDFRKEVSDENDANG